MRLNANFFGVRFALAALVLILGAQVSAPADGGELDHEKNVTNVQQRALAERLPGTVVVRINQADGSGSVFHSDNVLPAAPSTQATIQNATFAPMLNTDRV